MCHIMNISPPVGTRWRDVASGIVAPAGGVSKTDVVVGMGMEGEYVELVVGRDTSQWVASPNSLNCTACHCSSQVKVVELSEGTSA